MSELLSQIEVSISDLVLDPHNPRFENSFIGIVIPKGEIWSEEVQGLILKRFSVKDGCSDPEDDGDNSDVTNISILYKSIMSTGFQTIDKIVVRKLDEAPDKYLVVEGNRRVAALKTIRKNFDDEIAPFDKSKERESKCKLIKSFENIPCQLLNMDGLSPADADHRIRVILGLRHHGSLLEWDPLPKARNIFKEYMRHLSDGVFTFSRDIGMQVGDKLSISVATVRESLEAYVAFQQLVDAKIGPEKEHFSLVKELATKRDLFTYQYLNKDKTSFKLEEPSLERIGKLCLFKNRKISVLENPKKVGRLASLVRATHDPTLPANVRVRAQIYLSELEEGKIKLDEALSAITRARREAKWIDEFVRLLNESDMTINPNTFTGAGNDLLEKQKVKLMLDTFAKLCSFRN